MRYNTLNLLPATPKHALVALLPFSTGLSKSGLPRSPVRVQEGREYREKGQEEAHDRVEHPLLKPIDRTTKRKR